MIINRKQIPLILIILIIFSILLGSCAFGKNSKESVPNSGINLASFFIDNQNLPEGWFIGEIGPGVYGYRGTDSAGSQYFPANYPSTEPDLIRHSVYRQETIRDAVIDYSDETFEFFIYETDPPWSYQSQVADESGIFCEYQLKEILNCRWIARYQNIVITVGGWVQPEYMTIADLENIVIKIDQKAAEYFSSGD